MLRLPCQRGVVACLHMASTKYPSVEGTYKVVSSSGLFRALGWVACPFVHLTLSNNLKATKPFFLDMSFYLPRSQEDVSAF